MHRTAYTAVPGKPIWSKTETTNSGELTRTLQSLSLTAELLHHLRFVRQSNVYTGEGGTRTAGRPGRGLFLVYQPVTWPDEYANRCRGKVMDLHLGLLSPSPCWLSAYSDPDRSWFSSGRSDECRIVHWKTNKRLLAHYHVLNTNNRFAIPLCKVINWNTVINWSIAQPVVGLKRSLRLKIAGVCIEILDLIILLLGIKKVLKMHPSWNSYLSVPCLKLNFKSFLQVTTMPLRATTSPTHVWRM